jgi:hypothetical protein
MRGGRKRFFFEKKKQKTFIRWSLAQAVGLTPSGAAQLKVFCFFFSKKKRFLPSLA